MSEATPGNEDLAPAIARIIAGPLDGFVTRRDALAKELRATGRRDDARTIKSLRKPSRMAWALDVASLERPACLEQVASAVAATVVAQSGRSDLRAAINHLRDTVNSLADAACEAATNAGFELAHGQVINAVMAVVGAPGALEELRVGRLVDVPEGGGLDFFVGPAPTAAAADAPAADPSADSLRSTALEETLRRAEAALESARERSGDANRALRDAETKVLEAERALQSAERGLFARKAERAHARAVADRAAGELRDAERIVSKSGGHAGEE